MIDLGKHPVDWILHGLGCFILVVLGWVNPIIMLVLGMYLEYEQKQSIHYSRFDWKTYFLKHAGGDLLADMSGIILAIIVSGLFI
jgi:hypothetical protein